MPEAQKGRKLLGEETHLPILPIPGSPLLPSWKQVKAVWAPNQSFEDRFNRLVDVLAPQLPYGSPKALQNWRQKMVDVGSPALLNKYLPPMPKGLRDQLKKKF